MLSRNQIKFYTSLRFKKFREEYGVFLAEGDKIVQELIMQPQEFLNLKTLLATADFLKEAIHPKSTLIINELSWEELRKISSLTSPNRAILEIEIPKLSWEPKDISNQFSFFMENLQDPGNLGTIIRTADWFGIRNVFCSPGSVDIYNPKVIQATMGSFSRVRVFYESSEIFKTMPEFYSEYYSKVAALLQGENLYEADLGKQGVIFFGNESKGLSKEIIELSNKRVCIARDTDHSGAESLNVSIAAGIFGSELLRKKLIRNEN